MICRDDVDLAIVDVLLWAGSEGMLPKDIVARLAMHKVSRWHVFRRLVRMNKRLKTETSFTHALRLEKLMLLANVFYSVTKLKVELIHYSPEDPDLHVALTMRRSRDASSIQEISRSLANNRVWIGKLVRLAKKKGHYSVFEHVVYWFNVEQVSRALTHELVRHRIASYAQLSGRIVNVDNGYVIPPLDYVKDKSELTQLQEFFESKYKEQFKTYKSLVEKGVKVEDARYVLPNGQWTCIMMTLNARSLMHIIRMRMSPEAHWEIRELANRMRELVEPTAPLLFESIPDDI